MRVKLILPALMEATSRPRRRHVGLPVLETILSEFGRRPAPETFAAPADAVVPYGHETA